jgi:hypothetical protein
LPTSCLDKTLIPAQRGYPVFPLRAAVLRSAGRSACVAPTAAGTIVLERGLDAALGATAA